MTEDDRGTESLYAYTQLDAAARAPLFDGFLRELKQLARDEAGSSKARKWAVAAVGPHLDYSSLMKLGRFLPPLSAAATGTNPGLRFAILGGSTTNQLRQLMEIFLAAEGITAHVYESDYGLFRQEILSPGSGLDAFRPQVVFLATSARDVARMPLVDMDEATVSATADEEVADWAGLWRAANQKWNATVIQNNFEIAPGGAWGHFALRFPAAREHYLDRLNRLLAERAPSHVVMHDVRGLAAEIGARNWFEPRFYHEFKMPCGPEGLVAYAHSVVCLVRAITGKSKKVLALDLDNTLWGGVVGDLGPAGIRMGQGSGEGEAYLAFQRYAKELQQRGVLLAVCSKNDPEKAREPFEKRSDMALKLTDISCFVANWENKADNLRAIAERLELKLDSIVFVDDNPAERALVRRLAPEVAVPDLPEDPSGYIQALSAHRYFEPVAFTREDASRARYYADNARRKDMAGRSADIGSFLASLRMRMKVEPVNELNIERAAQLVNKSNQFNLTTKRYTVAQLREMAGSRDYHTLTLSLGDSLGDNGLISIILLRRAGESLSVDTWVMSCRVLQRGVEHFARNELVRLARAQGCTHLLGTYAPTAKNAMVKDHYASLGFKPAGVDGDQTYWELEVDGEVHPLPHHIEQEVGNE
jgi:FkbH-like protein